MTMEGMVLRRFGLSRPDFVEGDGAGVDVEGLSAEEVVGPAACGDDEVVGV